MEENVHPLPTDEMERERLVADVMQEPEKQQGRWRITDKASAWWAVRQVAKARARMAENVQLRNAEMERIERWLEAENAPWARTAAFFEGHLSEWHRRLLEEDPKAKTVRTPFGSLQLRAAQPEWRYNETGLLAWLQTNRPDLIRVTEAPDKAELRRAVALQLQEEGVYRAVMLDTGEVVDGVSAVDRPPTFAVKIDPEEVPSI